MYNNSDPILNKNLNAILKNSNSYEEVLKKLTEGNKEEVKLANELNLLLKNLAPMDDSIAQQAENYTAIPSKFFKSQTELEFHKTPYQQPFFNKIFLQNIVHFLKDPLNPSGASFPPNSFEKVWNKYLKDELKYSTDEKYIYSNERANEIWDYSHKDPENISDGSTDLFIPAPTGYYAGDLANAMKLNPNLKVFQASGYYDSSTPFYQTDLDIKNMFPEGSSFYKNIFITKYFSSHFISMDDLSRSQLKINLDKFYDNVLIN